jgi:hypothetical protein
MMERHDVFISHSAEDRPAVERLLKQLDREHISYWTDRGIRPGHDWASEIETAIETAKVFIVFVTPSFLASDWAWLEMGAALAKQREGGAEVIPVVTGPVDLPPVLRKFHPVNAEDLSTAELVRRIKKSDAIAS